jgi:hypothetical protein
VLFKELEEELSNIPDGMALDFTPMKLFTTRYCIDRKMSWNTSIFSWRIRTIMMLYSKGSREVWHAKIFLNHIDEEYNEPSSGAYPRTQRSKLPEVGRLHLSLHAISSR